MLRMTDGVIRQGGCRLASCSPLEAGYAACNVVYGLLEPRPHSTNRKTALIGSYIRSRWKKCSPTPGPTVVTTLTGIWGIWGNMGSIICCDWNSG